MGKVGERGPGGAVAVSLVPGKQGSGKGTAKTGKPRRTTGFIPEGLGVRKRNQRETCKLESEAERGECERN